MSQSVAKAIQSSSLLQNLHYSMPAGDASRGTVLRGGMVIATPSQTPDAGSPFFVQFGRLPLKSHPPASEGACVVSSLPDALFTLTQRIHLDAYIHDFHLALLQVMRAAW